ncbi:helix-turn-helix domain-containing protein [Paraburkholderia sp. RL17-381-BIF-C]|uniref:helix-turn-helix domain-containing protein n=1 Tax=Paraburkholderia sp. RL17-381-BIF-C TaxID=3031635 RepID=UPI0038B7D22C
MNENIFSEPAELPGHLTPLFIVVGYVYADVEDQEAYLSGFVRLTNALIAAGSRGEIAVFHPVTLLPYHVHNGEFEEDPDSPLTANWVARIGDVLRWFAVNNIEAASPLLNKIAAHELMRTSAPIDRRQAMVSALERNDGNKTKTAEEFGISRQRLSQIIGQSSAPQTDRKPLALVAQDPFGIARKSK